MKTLLQINTSLNAGSGQSSLLADSFVAAWKASHPGAAIKTRNLATDEVPHLTAERFQAFITRPEARTPAQQAIAAYSDALIDELKSADVVVLGLPMYNFGIPSQLKAYFDHIARAGVTFRYKDYLRGGPERQRVMALAPHEFIRRFLLHVLPHGFHRIRHYGLLASFARKADIARARELLAGAPAPSEPTRTIAPSTLGSASMMSPTLRA